MQRTLPLPIIFRRYLGSSGQIKTIHDVPTFKELPVLGHLHLFLPGGKKSLI